VIIALLFVSLCTFLAGGLIPAFLRRGSGFAVVFGPVANIAGCAVGLLGVILSMIQGPAESGSIHWGVPSGSLAVGIDPLSALFALPVLVISALCAVHGCGYMKPQAARGKDMPRFWAFCNLLTGGMLLVTAARNALLFLLGWEVMALASFFLVLFDSGREPVRRAAWIYLVATHLGTACILLLFSMLGSGGSLEFAGLSLPHPSLAGAAFVLALLGFGTKAGFVPFHVWLPEAHPSAPSNVSAVMSGVMIKTGIYGLLRFMLFLGPPPSWWGWTLLGAGLLSGVAGVLMALAQHELKRMLAYSSVENVGIIGMGLGTGLLGISYGIPAMAFLGFAGAFLHVLNHSVFKSLLFLASGAIGNAAGTRELDRLGGLMKRMPVTGAAFLVGSAAICGLPPLNGFVGELTAYLAAFSGIVNGAGTQGALPGMIAAGGLALMGGLALACFTKAFGMAFLGAPRSAGAGKACESSFSMRLPLVVLSILCLLMGLGGWLLVGLVEPVVGTVTAGLGYPLSTGVHAGFAESTLRYVSIGSVSVIAAGLLLLFARSRLLARRSVTVAPTWGCGYGSPEPSMQYTASSFADPLTGLFGPALGTRREPASPGALFPDRADFSSNTPDACTERFYIPLFSGMERFFKRLRVIQHGRINLYVLSIVVALAALLSWKLG